MTNKTNQEVEQNEKLSEAERKFFADEPDLDPYDLSALKPKRKPLRIVLALAVILACSYLLYDTKQELSYFFQNTTPQALGSLDEPDNSFKQQVYERELTSNVFANVKGTPNYPPFLWETAGGLGRGPGKGQHARLVVFPPLEGATNKGIEHVGQTVRLSYTPLAVIYYEENNVPREHLRGDFDGRLVQLKDAPFLGPIRKFLWKNYSLSLPEDSYILLDGEKPSSAWVYAVFGLLALVAILYNLYVLVKQLLASKEPKNA
jgi:hypothetical protein